MTPLGASPGCRLGGAGLLVCRQLAGQQWRAGILLSLSLVLGPRPWPAETSAVAVLVLYACSFFNCQNLFQGQVSLLMVSACLAWAVCCSARAGILRAAWLLAAGCALEACSDCADTIPRDPQGLAWPGWRGPGRNIGRACPGALDRPGWDRAIAPRLVSPCQGNARPLPKLPRRQPGLDGHVVPSAPDQQWMRFAIPTRTWPPLEEAYLVLGRRLGRGGSTAGSSGIFRTRSQALAAEQWRQRDNLYLILLFVFP